MARRDRPDRIRLVVVFGGQSAEHEVSCVTARHVVAAADPERYEIVPIGIQPGGRWVVADPPSARTEGSSGHSAALRAEGPEIGPLPAIQPRHDTEPVVVFPLLHGPLGEDGTIQGLLELAGVPYVGTGVLGSALSMDKVKAKEISSFHQIPQAAYAVRHEIDTSDPAAAVPALGGYPVFVKPANMGSSIGVSKVHGTHDLTPALELAFQYDEWALIEESITGREIEVGVLGGLEPEASVPGEVRAGSDFYDFEDKYVDGRAELLIPAPLGPDATQEVRQMALRAFSALRCEGMARVDFFYEESGRGFILNEVNTIPGFTPHSMYPKLWEMSGVSYPDLIDELVACALSRHQRREPRRLAGRRPSLHRDAAGPDVSAGDHVVS